MKASSFALSCTDVKFCLQSKLSGKGFISEKHDSSGLGSEKKAAPSRESDSVSVGSDIPYDSDRKEKFKMVISKSKKDGQDPPSKLTQPQIAVSVDAAAAAAILQVATRGIKNPNLEIISKTSLNVSSQAPSGEGGHGPSFSSHLSSQPRSSTEKPGQKGEPSVSGPVVNAIAKTAAIAAASEADSSEACLTKEEKLKAERLKRAKMFAALIKSGSAPLKTETSRGLSAEPPESGVSGSGAEGGSLLSKEREGSSVALDAKTSDKNEKHENIYSGIDHNDRRSKRKYQSRSKRHEEDSRQDEEEEEEEKEKEKDKHSHKKRRSHHSSHHSKDRRKHKKRHSSSKDRDKHSQHRHKHDRSSDDERGHMSDYSETDHHHSRNRRKRDKFSDTEHQRSRTRNEHNCSSEDERLYSRHSHKHDRSSDDEDRRHWHNNKQRSPFDDESLHRRKRSHSRREVELEEGEIGSKSDQSKLCEGNGASREASVDTSKADTKGRAPSLPSETTTTTTTISDDLRAKIRAMLMATL